MWNEEEKTFKLTRQQIEITYSFAYQPFIDSLQKAAEALRSFAEALNAMRYERLQRNVFFYTLACMALVQLLAVVCFL